jgi:hypothetical protein
MFPEASKVTRKNRHISVLHVPKQDTPFLVKVIKQRDKPAVLKVKILSYSGMISLCHVR